MVALCAFSYQYCLESNEPGCIRMAWRCVPVTTSYGRFAGKLEEAGQTGDVGEADETGKTAEVGRIGKVGNAGVRPLPVNR